MIGIKAPPAIPMIKIAEPLGVNRPKSARARGHKVGHTMAFAKPKRAMRAIESGTVAIPDQPHNIVATNVASFDESKSKVVIAKPASALTRSAFA